MTRIQIGKDLLSCNSFAPFKPTLAKLAGQFEAGGFVHLQHCDVGLNTSLMEMFADAIGVPVVAGTGATHATHGYNTGKYVRVYPVRPTYVAGRFFSVVRKPKETFCFGPWSWGLWGK